MKGLDPVFFRVFSAGVLLYLYVATLGVSGSYAAASKITVFLIVAWILGFLSKGESNDQKEETQVHPEER